MQFAEVARNPDFAGFLLDRLRRAVLITPRSKRGKRSPASRSYYMVVLRNRKAFPITDTELRLIASAAIIGLSKRPVKG